MSSGMGLVGGDACAFCAECIDGGEGVASGVVSAGAEAGVTRVLEGSWAGVVGGVAVVGVVCNKSGAAAAGVALGVVDA